MLSAEPKRAEPDANAADGWCARSASELAASWAAQS